MHFFDGGLQPRWDKHKEGARLYQSYFPLRSQMSKGCKAFEATPCYMFNPLAPSRMARMVPDAQLIVLLRDPVERAISHYFHERRRRRETLPLQEALQAEQRRLAPVYRSGDYKDTSWINHSYVKRGLYAEQLKRVFAHYPRNRVLVLESSKFYLNPKHTVNLILDFLNIDITDPKVQFDPIGVGTNRTEVDPETLDWLTARFAEPNAYLEELLGRGFDWAIK